MSVLNRKQRLFNAMQGLLPQHLLSRIMLGVTRWRWRPWKNLQIHWFIKHYGVNMQEAVSPTADDYTCFNDFFTRSLKADARPIAPGEKTLIAPVDGTVSQADKLRADNIIQAKGHDYSVTQLLAGDTALAEQFTDGAFATLYLSPCDYHRVHMPCSGQLQRMMHIPGRRFAVNQTSVGGIHNLFARNERLISVFHTAAGPLALVMVGALFVGSMQTVWTDRLPAKAGGDIQDYDYRNARINLGRGDEMGRFNMGSTVILLFAHGRLRWLPHVKSIQRIRMGEAIGILSGQQA